MPVMFSSRLRSVVAAGCAVLVAAALLAVAPPPADAQDDRGKQLGTATIRFGPDGPPSTETATGNETYDTLAHNFIAHGSTVAYTTYEVADITNSRDEIVGNRITVWCLQGWVCKWNGKRLGDGGTFEAGVEVVDLPEVEPYEEPDERDIARQRNPVGSAPANPRGRTVTTTHEPINHCGEWTWGSETYDSNYTDEQWEELAKYYQSDDLENPTICVLAVPEALWEVSVPVEGSDPPRMMLVPETRRDGTNVLVEDRLPATKPVGLTCWSGTLRGKMCVNEPAPEYGDDRDANRRLKTIVSPSSESPQYVAPTEAQIDRCRGDATCIGRLHVRAENQFNRDLESHDAQWARYEQEINEIVDSGEQFWACTTDQAEWVESWRDSDESYTPATLAPRCFLVG